MIRHTTSLLKIALALSLPIALASCDDGGSNNASDTVNTDAPAPDTTSDTTVDGNGDGNGDAGPDTKMVTIVDVPSGIDSRPANTACVAHPEPPPTPAAIDFEHVFDDVSTNRAVAMKQAPGDPATFYVVEQAGRILQLPSPTPGTRHIVGDITDRVDDGPNEAGFLDLAFHPDYPNTAEVFLSYTRGGPLTSRISRFAFDPATQLLDESSEEIIYEVEQPYGNHNGGGIGFGHDGLLYIGLGDGGSGGDPDGYGQNVNSTLGAFLRIDVDNPPAGSTYAIPADNPFAQGGGAPEIFAWGVRNPWRWSFDRETGDLWAGDVGQNSIEEIDVIELGGNYGWAVKEGTECFGGGSCEGDYVDPIVELPQSGGDRSITGGYVYRGGELTGYQGTYFFGDFASGNLYTVEYDADGEPFPQLMSSTPFSIAAFGEGLDGELYILNFGGNIQKLVLAAPPVDNGFPTTLSATGCVDAADVGVASSGLIPFAPVSELWSDGAAKSRWLGMPDGATATVTGSDIDYPIGTVFMKRFDIGGEPVETRLFMRHDDGTWAGYSYAWNAAGTDADLLESNVVRDLPNGQTWSFPSRGQCMQCHTSPAGFVLGPEVAQLNSELLYDDPDDEFVRRRSNQLATWDAIGLFDAPIGDPSSLPALVDPRDDTADIDGRARAYLHANCSSCHQPGARTQLDIDFRYEQALADTALCDVPTTSQTAGLADPRRIAPGNPDNSMVAVRMAHEGLLRMPPIGSAVVDDTGLTVIRDWITGLQGCP